jgi:uncharacterized protein YggE
MRWIVLVVIGLWEVGALPAAAQTVDAWPQIVTGGSADTLLQPTRASLSVVVTTSGATAAAASADNARISKLVIEAIQRAGVKREEIQGTHLGVNPHWEYDDKTRRSRQVDFEASNNIHLEAEALDQIGTYVDAALGAGATGIVDVSFTARDTEAARAQVLANAVAAARADAVVMARAGGGSLGELLLLTTERSGDSPGVGLNEVVVTGVRRMTAPVPTEIVPTPIRVSARVIARWRFVPAAATQPGSSR